MRRVVGPTLGIKAAGGIRSLQTLQELVAAGATRIGASASVKIMEEVAGTSSHVPPNRKTEDSY
jgi:deoxyribose-phosphate aldolase